MALSVVKGIYRHIGLESPQVVAGSEATGGEANLSLSATIGPYTLRSTVHTAAGGLSVYPSYPYWWGAYVAAELARQAAAREARAVSGDTYVVALGPWAEADVEAGLPIVADLVAALRPRVDAVAFVPRLLAVVEHAESLDEESAILLTAALMLAA